MFLTGGCIKLERKKTESVRLTKEKYLQSRRHSLNHHFRDIIGSDDDITQTDTP